MAADAEATVFAERLSARVPERVSLELECSVFKVVSRRRIGDMILVKKRCCYRMSLLLLPKVRASCLGVRWWADVDCVQPTRELCRWRNG